MLLTVSCVSAEVKREIPELSFPEFPEYEWYEVESAERIVIPADYFIGLAKFRNEYDGLIDEYTILKEKCNEFEN